MLNCPIPALIVGLTTSDPVILLDSSERKSLHCGESFEQHIGDVQIFENGCIVVHGRSINSGEVRGKLDYTLGKHQLRFKVEKISMDIFIGITSKSTPFKLNSCRSSSSYGWLSHDHYYEGGMLLNKGDIFSVYDVLENDIVELTIDMTTRKLHYKNERRTQSQELKIDLRKCPLPWQILVNLSGHEDQIRLLSYAPLT